MSREELHIALQRLRDEVAKLGASDPATAARLSQLMTEIDRHAGGPGADTALLKTLPEAIEQLEAEHPTITAILSRVVSMLSSMGI